MIINAAMNIIKGLIGKVSNINIVVFKQICSKRVFQVFVLKAIVNLYRYKKYYRNVPSALPYRFIHTVRLLPEIWTLLYSSGVVRNYLYPAPEVELIICKGYKPDISVGGKLFNQIDSGLWMQLQFFQVVKGSFVVNKRVDVALFFLKIVFENFRGLVEVAYRRISDTDNY